MYLLVKRAAFFCKMRSAFFKFTDKAVSQNVRMLGCIYQFLNVQLLKRLSLHRIIKDC